MSDGATDETPQGFEYVSDETSVVSEPTYPADGARWLDAVASMRADVAEIARLLEGAESADADEASALLTAVAERVDRISAEIARTRAATVAVRY